MTIRKQRPALLIGVLWVSVAALFGQGNQPVPDEPLRLTLQQAIDIALSPTGSNNLQIAAQVLAEVAATSDEARSALLPHLSADLSQRRQTNNLEALGLGSASRLPIPRLVGPFSTFDARAQLDQVIFSWSAWQRYRSARTASRAAEVELERTRDAVAAATALAYLDAQQAEAQLQAAESHRRLAQDLVELAVSQKNAGTGTAIEVTRAEVNRAKEDQGLLRARSSLDDALLRLKKWLAMDLSMPIALEGPQVPDPSPGPDPENAITAAYTSRRDLQAQLLKEKAQQLSLAAERSERLPSLAGFADYGSLGTAPDASIPTWHVGIGLQIPIFTGGAIEARTAAGLARLKEEQIRTRELRDQIALEVRLALSAIALASGELAVAENAAELGRRELAQAERRYKSGVTTSLEVTEAQTHLTEAETGQISAAFRLAAARIQLSDSMGTLRTGQRP